MQMDEKLLEDYDYDKNINIETCKRERRGYSDIKDPAMRRAADRGDRSRIKQLRPTSIALPRLPFSYSSN